mmetsp:Transcript_687/g.1083  ORF Transcript_687/g.1083 Transcript_687/m.1083 type:complete len:265 (+) Transcript_687:399-1193(+)
MFLWINFPCQLDKDFLSSLSFFSDDPIIVLLGEFEHFFHDLLIFMLMVFKFINGKPCRPILLVEVHEHLFFKFIFAVINDNGVIVSIKSMNECLNGWFIEMSNIRSSLPGRLTKHHELRVDKPKAVNDDLSLDGLNGIDNECNSSRVKSLKRRLRIDVGGREPAPESRMGVIPAHDHFASSCLLQHVEHFSLKYGIYRFDRHGCSALGHGEYVDAVDGVVVNELSEHEAHYFHGNSRSSVLEHFEESQGRYVDFLCAIWKRRVG